MATTECIDCGTEIEELQGFVPRCSSCQLKAKESYLTWLTTIWGGAPKYRNNIKCDLDSPERRYRGATFATINGNPNMPDVQAKVMPFINDKVQSMLFIGPAGTGKTWAAWATTFGWMIKNFGRLSTSVRFIRWSWLLAAIDQQASFGQTGADGHEKVKSLATCGLLVIDEFGMSKPTNNQFNNVMTLIDIRHAEMLPTLVISNQSEAELIANIGSPIISRFARGIVAFNGRDLRGEDK